MMNGKGELNIFEKRNPTVFKMFNFISNKFINLAANSKPS